MTNCHSDFISSITKATQYKFKFFLATEWKNFFEKKMLEIPEEKSFHLADETLVHN